MLRSSAVKQQANRLKKDCLSQFTNSMEIDYKSILHFQFQNTRPKTHLWSDSTNMQPDKT